ncbi:acyl-CoA dehydrogenase family protein [Tatumella citrea]|uniref:Acyl-CoA dehydrogenase/oxidase N-terminal domain-containing protein n=1 Tax=Tatumella citrea TaxID=53336 RepID=A0A1Y0LQ57_TATCI|nr:acyl-CoA dehydrogenase family protein [Tatumella citrea]ARU95627.1 hypothetical protein A7K98_19005 [Tatumella citrea]ARU99669.1 hypothetical protein A7K99_18990 [Tatumella citrea]
MISHALLHWLEQHALEIDQTAELSHEILRRLGQEGLFAIGVATEYGGSGGDFTDAVQALSEVASHSMTAAFMFWGHRTYIELLVRSPQYPLHAHRLPALLSGEYAGATGLSNMMKFLNGIEEINLSGESDQGGWQVSGQLFWVTNLQPEKFSVVTAVQPKGGAVPFIATISSDLPGVERSADLSLMSMQGSATAALQFTEAVVDERSILYPDATVALAYLRPHFLGLQCGMALGLAARSLSEISDHSAETHPLRADYQTTLRQYDSLRSRLFSGLANGQFQSEPRQLFQLRIALIELTQRVIQTELMIKGGRAYLSPVGDQFARRWRESAFLPLVTPSVVQLRQQLQGDV